MTLTEQLHATRNMTMSRMPQSIIQTFENGIEDIRANGLVDKALKVGDNLPDFSLLNIYGSPTKSGHVHNSEFLVLNFYRGGWCPYCNMELRAYEKLKKDFENAGANIVAISAEVPQMAEQTASKNDISYPVLTDVDARFMKEIGIVFQLNENEKKEFLKFGMDFTQIHANENYELPVPAVYVINKNMKIVFVHFEADYMTRIEPSEVLNIIKEL